MKRELRLELEWGRGGVRCALAPGKPSAVLVVVDALSFSTSAAIAAHRGARLFPCASAQEALALAASDPGVRAAGKRSKSGFSLSPSGCLAVQPGERLALASPNGASCCALGRSAKGLLAGSLANASATAEAALLLARERGAERIAVVACGERWPDDGPLAEPGEQIRFALEDWLGAGAVLSKLEGAASAEALAAGSAFLASRGRLGGLLRGCESGLELIGRGFPEDVEIASRVDGFPTAAVMDSSGWLGKLLG